MLGFKSFLNEDYAPLYHFTSYDGLVKIIQSGELEMTFSTSTGKNRICFTRNANMVPMFKDDAIFRLQFDKNKLAATNKIELYTHTWTKGEESEERISGKIKPEFKRLYDLATEIKEFERKKPLFFRTSEEQKHFQELHNEIKNLYAQIAKENPKLLRNGRVYPDQMTSKIPIKLDKYLMNISVAPYFEKYSKQYIKTDMVTSINGFGRVENITDYYVDDLMSAFLKGADVILNSKYAEKFTLKDGTTSPYSLKVYNMSK